MGLGSYSPSNNSCAPDGALLSVISCLLLESTCLSCLRDAVATTRYGLALVAGRSRSMDCSDIMLCSKVLSEKQEQPTLCPGAWGVSAHAAPWQRKIGPVRWVSRQCSSG